MPRLTDAARNELPALQVRWARLEQAGEAEASPQAPAEAHQRSVEDVKASGVAQAYRSLFWTMDVDPTKRRPAGEALARRAAAGGLPSIHPLVDAYNAASAATLVALSAFDEAALEGELLLDLPREGEALDAIGEAEPVEPTGTHPVWRDEEGLVGLAAYRDAKRTALGPNSRQAIVVALAPGEVPDERLEEAFELVEEQAADAGWRLVDGPGTLATG